MRARRPDRLELRLESHFIHAVDDWMRRHPDFASRSSAILHLAELGLSQDSERSPSDEGLRPEDLNSENDG